MLQKSHPMALRGWREAMMAPTIENVSSGARVKMASTAPSERDNESPPPSSAAESATSDHASQGATRALIPPLPRPRFLVPCVTTPTLQHHCLLTVTTTVTKSRGRTNFSERRLGEVQSAPVLWAG